MALMGALKEQLNDEKQQTENGAIGYRTSGRHLLEFCSRQYEKLGG